MLAGRHLHNLLLLTLERPVESIRRPFDMKPDVVDPADPRRT
jgi:hypothetical protein